METRETPTFTVPRFHPHPFLYSGHLQTIIGSYLWSGKFKYQARRHTMTLADGDQIILHDDTPPDWKPGGPITLLVHGLGGSHLSIYVVRAAAKLNAMGVRTFRMDLRGCGEGYMLARKPVHAGRSEDIASTIACLRKLCPGSPIVAVGYSMAGNMVLKMAGEMGSDVPAMLDSVVAINPPIDLHACSRMLGAGWGKIYDAHYVRRCLSAAAQRKLLIPDALHRELNPKPRSLREFDTAYTAPLGEFRDVDHYYEHSSAARVINDIAVPTLIITAVDDPIIPVSTFETLQRPDHVLVHIAEGGGHLGFLAAKPGTDPDRRWIDWRVVDWVRMRMATAATRMVLQDSSIKVA